MRFLHCHKLHVVLTALRRCALILVVLGAVTGCTSLSQQQSNSTSAAVYDPIEPVNRIVFAFNDAVDVVVIRPISIVYADLLPDPVKDSIRSFLRWLKSPIILANELLQGNLDAASATTERFFVKAASLGLVEAADAEQPPYRSEDFGQTLAVYNVGAGPYLVLPFIGPSNLRDLIGTVVDSIIDPLATPVTVLDPQKTATTLSVSRQVLTGVDFRGENLTQIDGLKRESLDYYATVRTIYNQQRVSEILNGEQPTGVSTQTDDQLFQSFEPTEDGVKPAQSGQPAVDN